MAQLIQVKQREGFAVHGPARIDTSGLQRGLAGLGRQAPGVGEWDLTDIEKGFNNLLSTARGDVNFAAGLEDPETQQDIQNQYAAYRQETIAQGLDPVHPNVQSFATAGDLEVLNFETAEGLANKFVDDYLAGSGLSPEEEASFRQATKKLWVDSFQMEFESARRDHETTLEQTRQETRAAGATQRTEVSLNDSVGHTRNIYNIERNIADLEKTPGDNVVAEFASTNDGLREQRTTLSLSHDDLTAEIASLKVSLEAAQSEEDIANVTAALKGKENALALTIGEIEAVDASIASNEEWIGKVERGEVEFGDEWNAAEGVRLQLLEEQNAILEDEKVLADRPFFDSIGRTSALVAGEANLFANGHQTRQEMAQKSSGHWAATQSLWTTNAFDKNMVGAIEDMVFEVQTEAGWSLSQEEALVQAQARINYDEVVANTLLTLNDMGRHIPPEAEQYRMTQEELMGEVERNLAIYQSQDRLNKAAHVATQDSNYDRYHQAALGLMERWDNGKGPVDARDISSLMGMVAGADVRGEIRPEHHDNIRGILKWSEADVEYSTEENAYFDLQAQHIFSDVISGGGGYDALVGALSNVVHPNTGQEMPWRIINKFAAPYSALAQHGRLMDSFQYAIRGAETPSEVEEVLGVMSQAIRDLDEGALIDQATEAAQMSLIGMQADGKLTRRESSHNPYYYATNKSTSQGMYGTWEDKLEVSDNSRVYDDTVFAPTALGEGAQYFDDDSFVRTAMERGDVPPEQLEKDLRLMGQFADMRVSNVRDDGSMFTWMPVSPDGVTGNYQGQEVTFYLGQGFEHEFGEDRRDMTPRKMGDQDQYLARAYVNGKHIYAVTQVTRDSLGNITRVGEFLRGESQGIGEYSSYLNRDFRNLSHNIQGRQDLDGMSELEEAAFIEDYHQARIADFDARFNEPIDDRRFRYLEANPERVSPESYITTTTPYVPSPREIAGTFLAEQQDLRVRMTGLDEAALRRVEGPGYFALPYANETLSGEIILDQTKEALFTPVPPEQADIIRSTFEEEGPRAAWIRYLQMNPDAERPVWLRGASIEVQPAPASAAGYYNRGQ